MTAQLKALLNPVPAYSARQRRLGYSGSAAEGVAGASSLTMLATRHGLIVTN